MNLASSVQKIYEEIFFSMLRYHNKKYNLDSLSLSGGCVQNSVANGKIKEETNFKNIYIPPAAGDAGGAIGSSMFFLKRHKIHHDNNFDYAYLGSYFTNDEISEVIKNNQLQKLNFEIKNLNDESLNSEVAKSLNSGKVVGWFKGKMEWGPRALGNRSILYNPGLINAKDVLNIKIKRRENFRPFAPAIMHEYCKDWFEGVDGDNFMSSVYKVKKEKISL